MQLCIFLGLLFSALSEAARSQKKVQRSASKSSNIPEVCVLILEGGLPSGIYFENESSFPVPSVLVLCNV